MNYEEIMLRAISEAEKYKYTAKPNPVVGAILIKGKEIISEERLITSPFCRVTPSIIRDEYLKQMRSHLEEIKKICAETQSSHYETITDSPVDEALREFSFERTQV